MYQLSASQQWRKLCTQNDAHVNNVLYAYLIEGSLDDSKLCDAIGRLIRQRYPILFCQIINNQNVFSDVLPTVKRQQVDQSLTSVMLALQQEAHNIEKDPLFEAYLWCLTGSNQKVLVIRANHLIIDLNSVPTFIRVLARYYTNGDTEELVPDNGFRIFADKEQQRRNSPSYQDTLDALAIKYFQTSSKTIGLTKATVLHQASKLTGFICQNVIVELENFAKQHGHSWFSILYAWIATVINNSFREIQPLYGLVFCQSLLSPKLKESIGPFSDNQIIFGLEDSKTLKEAADICKQHILDGLSNKHPNMIDTYQAIGRTFNVFFDYQIYNQNGIQIADAKLIEIETPSPSIMRRDLSIKILKKDGIYSLSLRYSAEKILESAAKKLLDNLTRHPANAIVNE